MNTNESKPVFPNITPIDFPEKTHVLNKPESMTDEECMPLPVFSDSEQCISCWKFGWKERLKVLFKGIVWLGIISGRTQPPVWLAVEKPFENSK